jgi:hypothetical protein
LFAILVTRKISPSHAWLSKLAQVERLEVGIMNPQRSATVAAVLCGTGVVAWFACFGSARVENTAAPTLDRLASFLTADFDLADASQPTAIGNAGRALLHLITFDEPFGLSVVEALACGTPVIAFNRGSMPELIDDGVTGFLVDTLDQAVDAIKRIGDIDRAACRSAVSERFVVDRMADRYLDLYRSILG